MDALIYLTYLAIVILIGLICTLISDKLRIPNVLLLLLVGILLNNVSYGGKALIEFPIMFVTVISIIALVMIIFDSSSRFKFKEFDDFSIKALKLTGIFLTLNLIFLTLFTNYIFQPSSIFLSLMFASLMSGTSPDTVMIMLKDTSKRALKLLEIESIINTPIIVLLPFIMLDFLETFEVGTFFSRFVEQIGPFLQQIITGIGAGVLIGLVIFKIMRKKYSEKLSPLAVIAAALLTYVLAENLGGNGVLAVTTAGLFFGNIYVKEKANLQEFSALFSIFLEILVFILIGLLIKIPLNPAFFGKTALLFLVYLLIRFFSVYISFDKTDFNLKEKIFMTLVMPKGIAVAVVVAILIAYNIAGIQALLDVILMFMLYSIILATITLKFSKFFLHVNVVSSPDKLPKSVVVENPAATPKNVLKRIVTSKKTTKVKKSSASKAKK